MSRYRAPLVLAAMVPLGVLGALLSLALGAEHLPLGQVADVALGWFGGDGGPQSVSVIVGELRAPRTVLALVVGAGLALAGVLIQCLVRNPLADPYLLGVSSGAAVGATLVITVGVLSGLGTWALTGGAVLGALAAAAAVFGVAVAQGGLDPLRLVLTGVVLSSAFSSISSYLVFRSDAQGAQAVLHWLLGSLSVPGWSSVWVALGVVVLCLLATLLLAPWMDALAGGEDSARSLGIPVERLRTALFVISALLVGALVAVSGAIGFVGLIVPHLARLLVGARHRAMIPVAALMGGVFLVWVDVAARLLVAPRELPISIVTGLIGAPVFLLLMGRRQYRFSGAS